MFRYTYRLSDGLKVLSNYYDDETEVIIPDSIDKIGEYVFRNKKIVSVKIPESITEIQTGAFSGCEFLEEIEIPNSVRRIGEDAFRNCKKLKFIRMNPDIEIGSNAFKGCRMLFDENGWFVYDGVALAYRGNSTTVKIPCGIRVISAHLFSSGIGGNHKGKNICAVDFPEGLVEIREYAFAGCSRLEKIVIPNSVKKIGTGAFNGCDHLMSVIMPDSLEKIGDRVFAGCSGLEDDDGMIVIGGTLWNYEGPGGDVVIPDGVTSLSPSVFREGEVWSWKIHDDIEYRKEGSLKSIALPSTMKVINRHAFAGCKALTTIDIPDGVEMIGAGAFSDCVALNSASIAKSVVILESKAFSGCEHLSKIDMTEGIKTIGDMAFCNCKALKTISIPSSVESIGKSAFQDCEVLTEFIVSPKNKKYSAQDGMLISRKRDELIYCPAGKKLTEYTIPDNISVIAGHAFSDCKSLKKIVIPATVSKIGDKAFARRKDIRFTEIEIDINAGSKGVGRDVFGVDSIRDRNVPLIFPKVPVTFVIEKEVQIRLVLGYCQDPSKYEGAYSDVYKRYVNLHKKELLDRALRLRNSEILNYLTSVQDGIEGVSRNSPYLTMKVPNELSKVRVLETVVQKGSLNDLIAVLKTYKSFEITARALGIAARYRGIEHVKVLIKHGATFLYSRDSKLCRKYGMMQPRDAGNYWTEYYLMILPNKLDFGSNIIYRTETPMCGFSRMNIFQDMEPLGINKLIEIAKFFKEQNTPGVSMDELLFWALCKGELEFADALMEMGVTLQDTPPSYYSSYSVRSASTYLTIVTEGGRSVYVNNYIRCIMALDAKKTLPVLMRFNALAERIGKKIIISQKMLENMSVREDVFTYLVNNADLTKINQIKVLEMAVSKTDIAALKLMAEAGWLSKSNKREHIITFARKNMYNESLAWLMDFKNRTVDIAVEMAKEEAKLFKNLMENPNSVSALRKKWIFHKLEDGSVQITGYKGRDVEVEIPAKIGNNAVTSIGDEAFIVGRWTRKRVKNEDVRRQITSIIIPEGVTEIGDKSFYGLVSLEQIVIPSTLNNIGPSAFAGCRSLTSIIRSTRTKNSCKELPRVISKKSRGELGSHAFSGCVRLSHIDIPEGIKAIGNWAFYNCKVLETISIPASVKSIGVMVFQGCEVLSQFIVSSGNKKYSAQDGVLISKNHDTLICYPAGKDASEYVTPENTHVIAKYAFFECNSLNKIDVLNGVKTIENDAFCNCKVLKSISIAASVEFIGGMAFRGCEMLSEFIVSPENKAYSVHDGVLISQSTDLKIFPCWKNNS